MLMKIRYLATVACFGLLGLGGSIAHAQSSLPPETASQTFTVVVPQSISITAPDAVTLLHDESDEDQSFSQQAWIVTGNIQNGVLVSFATGSPFVHTGDSSFQRNARLDLGLASTVGPATWTISTNTDQTDYMASDGVATVQASSDGVGRAYFNLGVTFITEEFGQFAAGDYVTTVTGTVTAQ